ncbi:hypothetical protein Tco_0500428 [Tanacetum coccineum]
MGIEAIRLFLAYASFKDFVVYQMDVKSAFLFVTASKAEGRWDFISQDKYVTEILKKFGFTDVKTASTLWKLKSFCSRMKMVKKCVCLCKIPSQPKVVMSADSAITYTSVHFEARTWSIPSEDPYDEAARQLLEQTPRSPEYVPDPMELGDHVPVYIPEPEHPKDLVPVGMRHL